MSANKYKPHLVVLPEDDANRQIVNGFILDPHIDDRAMQVEKPAGGWKNVITHFSENHVAMMRSLAERRVLLLIDFDGESDRLTKVQHDIPDDVKKRVFVLGVWSNPEEFKQATRSTFEQIGERLADGCANGGYELWQHRLLDHNKVELNRLIADVRPFLFPA